MACHITSAQITIGVIQGPEMKGRWREGEEEGKKGMRVFSRIRGNWSPYTLLGGL